jgi:hypothetical protein
MAKLLGRDGYDDTDFFPISANQLWFYYLGYTATAGTITSLKARIRDGSATAIRMGLYNSSGNLVVESASISVTLSGAAQTATCAVTGTALTAATYYVGIVANGSCDIETANDGYKNILFAHTYGVLPASVAVPMANDNGGGEFALWGDGTVGGSSIAPLVINDTSIEDNQSGLTITMQGGVGGFGASQGTGTVIISPTDNVNDGSATPQTINGWGDTSINITGYRGSRALNTNLYLFVKNNSGQSNANGLVVQFVPTKYLKVLVDSSAQSATGIKGVVYQAPAGATIAGPEIGEFNSYTFSGTLESGQAVLKVPVAVFGGTSLTTSDTPVVLVRNTTHTTGIISATIIEE